MIILIIGLIVFFASHSVSLVDEGWRDRMAARFGVTRWRILYSLISVAGLALIVWGYALARRDPVVVYAAPYWMRHVSMLLLVPVFPLLFSVFLPGWISRTSRHPVLVAIKLWAVAHLLVNGMLADVLVFGCFLAWAVAVRISMKSRTVQPMPAMPVTRYNDVLAVVLGLGLYAVTVLWLHRWLIGVPPIP